MMKLSNRLARGLGWEYVFWCPGCKTHHGFNVTETGKPKWTLYSGESEPFDGNLDTVTVKPSIRISYGKGKVCHLFIKKGNIQYLDDCYHELKSSIIPMSDFEDD